MQDVEDEEERRRKRKEQKRAKKERKAQEQRETEASGNIGYFVMRTPSVLDNSIQDEDENRTSRSHTRQPLESRNTPFGQDTDQTSLDRRNSRVSSVRVNQQREMQEITIKDEGSSEDEGTQFFDSISTPSDQQRDKSMGVLSDKSC